MLLTGSAPVHAVQPHRLFILWMDGKTLSDWSSPGLPSFHRLLNEAAVGILSTRTARESGDPTVMRENAAATFGAGAQSAARNGKPLQLSGTTPGLLGDALARAGYNAAVSNFGSGDAFAGLTLAKRGGTLPRVIRADEFPEATNALLVDLGHAPLLQIDGVLGRLIERRSSGDVLVVISGDPPVARQRDGIRLSAVAIQGATFVPGLLTSPTTRRDGIITLTDLAPTIADALGLPPLAGVTGRVATVVPRAHPITYLRPLERDIVRASLDRYALTRWMMIIAMVAVAIALAVALWMRPSKAVGHLLEMLLIAVAAAPLSLYVNGVFHPSSLSVAALEAVALALGLALLARAFGGPWRALAIVLALTALVPLIDLLLGTPLGIRSPIAFQIASGGRFYGIDGGTLGVIVGAEIFAAALLVERAQDKLNAGRLIALVFAASVWLMGAPSYGSKFGAALTAIPAFGVLSLLIAGRRLTKGSAAAIGAATIAVTGLLIGVDALRNTGSQSHVARAVEGKSGVGAIISRKVHLQYLTTFHTIWTPAILVFAAAIAVILWRRRDLAARALEWHTLLKPALLAALVGAVAGFVFNDGGVLVAAPIAMFAAVSVFSTLLAPG